MPGASLKCINPSAWVYLEPSKYCDVGNLNFELNCAGFYSKSFYFFNSVWISMKLETTCLGMCKIFKYPIKFYLKNLTWCEMP